MLILLLSRKCYLARPVRSIQNVREAPTAFEGHLQTDVAYLARYQLALDAAMPIAAWRHSIRRHR